MNIIICEDCRNVEIDAASALDYHYSEQVATERLAEALRKVDEHLDNWAVDQCHDTIVAALHPTAAQEDKK